MAKVRVIARIQAHDGKTLQVRELMRRMLEPTRKEKGCEFYDLYEVSGTGLFYFDELWTSQEDLDAHAASSHFQAIFGEAGPMLQAPPEVSLVTELHPLP